MTELWLFDSQLASSFRKARSRYFVERKMSNQHSPHISSGVTWLRLPCFTYPTPHDPSADGEAKSALKRKLVYIPVIWPRRQAHAHWVNSPLCKFVPRVSTVYYASLRQQSRVPLRARSWMVFKTMEIRRNKTPSRHAYFQTSNRIFPGSSVSRSPSKGREDSG